MAVWARMKGTVSTQSNRVRKDLVYYWKGYWMKKPTLACRCQECAGSSDVLRRLKAEYSQIVVKKQFDGDYR